MPIAVYGTAKAGEVNVTLDTGVDTKADTVPPRSTQTDTGAAELPAREAGGPYVLRIAGADKTVTLKNVLVGEVWILSGQSNMELHVPEVKDGAAEVAAAKHDDIRLYNVPKAISNAPVDDVVGNWDVCSPETAKNFSAVGYFMGRELAAKLKVPVGLIKFALVRHLGRGLGHAGDAQRRSDPRAHAPQVPPGRKGL